MERTLKKGYQFRRVLRSGRVFRGKTFKAIYRANSLGVIRLGFSLPAKCGNAVKRNLLRRRLKNLSMKIGSENGADIVIMPMGKLKECSWETVKDDFQRLIEKLESQESIV